MTGWPLSSKEEGGKSGLHGRTAPVNGRRARAQGKCHREQTADHTGPPRSSARVKRCGKSAPRGRQRTRHGKPRREQDCIGGWVRSNPGQAASAPDPRVGRVRRSATIVPEEWPSRDRKVPDRTRLTGHLADLHHREAEPVFRRDSGTLEELLIRHPRRAEGTVAHHFKVILQLIGFIGVDFFCHAAKWQKSKIFHDVTGYSH